MTLEEDLSYLLTCIKHAGFTPDYDAIAKDAGLKDRKAAYDKYRRLTMRLGNASSDATSKGTAPQKPGKKRGRKSMKEKKEQTQSFAYTEVKREASDVDSDNAESPHKKAKTVGTNGA